jgi:hypothetical protein
MKASLPGVMEYWSAEAMKQLDIICCAFRVAGCGLSTESKKKRATRNPQLKRFKNFLFFDDEMHPPVSSAGLFGFSGIDWAFFAETDRYKPVSFDAFAD